MTKPEPELTKLEDSKIWLETEAIVDYMYGLLGDFTEDEKYASESKLRNASNDLLFSVAEAIGDSSPAATEYVWSYVRKHAMGLKAIYRFCARQKMIEIEPSIMVRLDKLLKMVDQEVKKAYERTKQTHKAEVEHWKQTYRLQKEDWS
jgi:hypothetical protein